MRSPRKLIFNCTTEKINIFEINGLINFVFLKKIDYLTLYF